MDAPPPAPADDEPSRRDETEPYRLPGPLSQRRPTPVALTAPRIPRALRAYNGTSPSAGERGSASSAHPAGQPPSQHLRAREGRTIRDLLEAADHPAESEEGPMAGLRGALNRLRRAAGRPREN